MVKRRAKRKKSKESKSSPTYSVELTGLILILIGIIGMGFGIIGNFLRVGSMSLTSLKIFLHILSSNEWNVITQILPFLFNKSSDVLSDDSKTFNSFKRAKEN